MSRTLLVADDEPAIRNLLRDFFEAQGYTVVTAEDGKQALAVAREARPDLVLLDVMMPWMNGFDVVRELRREGETPVILLTARTEESDKIAGLGLGAWALGRLADRPGSPAKRYALLEIGIGVWGWLAQ